MQRWRRLGGWRGEMAQIRRLERSTGGRGGEGERHRDGCRREKGKRINGGRREGVTLWRMRMVDD